MSCHDDNCEEVERKKEDDILDKIKKVEAIEELEDELKDIEKHVKLEKDEGGNKLENNK